MRRQLRTKTFGVSSERLGLCREKRARKKERKGAVEWSPRNQETLRSKKVERSKHKELKDDEEAQGSVAWELKGIIELVRRGKIQVKWDRGSAEKRRRKKEKGKSASASIWNHQSSLLYA